MPDISKLNVNGESFDISDDLARALLDSKINAPENGVVGQYLMITATGVEGANVPVTSVNGLTGDVSITIPTKVGDLTDSANYALKTDIPSMDGFASISYVDEKLGAINSVLDTINGEVI